MAWPQISTFLWVVISVFGISQAALNYADYDEDGPHPCQRPCEGSPPMVCDYHLKVEWFLTLSKACHDCPFNTTHCDAWHCVPGDGLRRPIVSINRRSPGPLIETCENDIVRATVENSLLDGQGVTVHWHGVHQLGTNHMDGAGMVSQCLITFGSNFTYEFTAAQPGTHFYHSHTGFQRGDGLYGGFIIHQTDDPHYGLYDHDCDVANGHCEYVIHVSDMHPAPAANDFVYQMFYRMPMVDRSAMIEGRNQKFAVEADNNPSVTELTPYQVFTVQQGKRYRFRVIQAGNGVCAFKVSVDGHNITVISSDGVPIAPVAVDTFSLFPGERYDFILTADQAVGNYWLNSIGLVDCLFDDAHAILRYEGAAEEDPADPPPSDRRGYFLNPILSDLGHPKYQHGAPYDIPTDELRSPYDEDFSDETVDVVHYMAMDFYDNDYTRFNHPDYPPANSDHPSRNTYVPNIDNITFHIPSVPVLTQPADLDPALLCNKTSVDPEQCYTSGCYCVHVEAFPLNQVVEVILVNEGVAFSGGGHPLHLHGYKFRILGIDKLGQSTSVAEVQQLDAAGELRRNYVSPVYKDTVTVPDGGYVVIRLYTDNPGYWFFHCHVESHVEQGQGVLFKVGTEADFPSVPADFPKCGSWA